MKRGTTRKQLKKGSRLPEGNREEARRHTSEKVERKRHRKSVAAQEVTGKCWTGIKHERNGLPGMDRLGRVEIFLVTLLISSTEQI